MNTYMLRSATNYGEVVHIVNADTEDDARNIVLNDKSVWDGYKIEIIDTKSRGVVTIGGGE